jgi:hypothetical protein
MQPVLIAFVVLLGVLAAANLLLTLALARRLAEVERAAPAGARPGPRLPRIGADVGAFSVPTIEGAQLTDARLRSGATLVVFSLAHCEPCAAMAEELRRTELPPGMGLLVLVAAGADDRQALAAVHYPAAADVALMPPDSGLTDQFEVDVFPTVILVKEGRITAVGHQPAEVLASLQAPVSG